MTTIEVIINPKGRATIQTKGFEGASCLEASRFLEQALGTRISHQETAEFYVTETNRA